MSVDSETQQVRSTNNNDTTPMFNRQMQTAIDDQPKTKRAKKPSSRTNPGLAGFAQPADEAEQKKFDKLVSDVIRAFPDVQKLVTDIPRLQHEESIGIPGRFSSSIAGEIKTWARQHGEELANANHPVKMEIDKQTRPAIAALAYILDVSTKPYRRTVPTGDMIVLAGTARTRCLHTKAPVIIIAIRNCVMVHDEWFQTRSASQPEERRRSSARCTPMSASSVKEWNLTATSSFHRGKEFFLAIAPPNKDPPPPDIPLFIQFIRARDLEEAQGIKHAKQRSVNGASSNDNAKRVPLKEFTARRAATEGQAVKVTISLSKHQTTENPLTCIVGASMFAARSIIARDLDQMTSDNIATMLHAWQSEHNLIRLFGLVDSDNTQRLEIDDAGLRHICSAYIGKIVAAASTIGEEAFRHEDDVKAMLDLLVTQNHFPEDVVEKLIASLDPELIQDKFCLIGILALLAFISETTLYHKLGDDAYIKKLIHHMAPPLPSAFYQDYSALVHQASRLASNRHGPAPPKPAPRPRGDKSSASNSSARSKPKHEPPTAASSQQTIDDEYTPTSPARSNGAVKEKAKPFKASKAEVKPQKKQAAKPRRPAKKAAKRRGRVLGIDDAASASDDEDDEEEDENEDDDASFIDDGDQEEGDEEEDDDDYEASSDEDGDGEESENQDAGEEEPTTEEEVEEIKTPPPKKAAPRAKSPPPQKKTKIPAKPLPALKQPGHSLPMKDASDEDEPVNKAPAREKVKRKLIPATDSEGEAEEDKRDPEPALEKKPKSEPLLTKLATSKAPQRYPDPAPLPIEYEDDDLVFAGRPVKAAPASVPVVPPGPDLSRFSLNNLSTMTFVKWYNLCEAKARPTIAEEVEAAFSDARYRALQRQKIRNIEGEALVWFRNAAWLQAHPEASNAMGPFSVPPTFTVAWVVSLKVACTDFRYLPADQRTAFDKRLCAFERARQLFPTTNNNCVGYTNVPVRHPPGQQPPSVVSPNLMPIFSANLNAEGNLIRVSSLAIVQQTRTTDLKAVNWDTCYSSPVHAKWFSDQCLPDDDGSYCWWARNLYIVFSVPSLDLGKELEDVFAGYMCKTDGVVKIQL